MTIVVVDTNLMCRNPDLSGATWSEIIRHVEERDIRVIVPEVVIQEVAAKIRATASVAAVQAARRPLVEAGLSDLAASVREHLEHRGDDAEDWFRSRVIAAGFEIADWPSVSHAEVTRRAAERIAPYTRTGQNKQEDSGNAGGRRNRKVEDDDQEGSNKDGYRDTLIWFTLRDVAVQHQSEDVWFVSQNYKDFGDVTSEETCPAPWHPDLASELEKDNQHRTFYARDLSEFQSRLASAKNPMDGEALAEAQKRLDLAQLQRLLDDKLYGFPVDPWEAGFPRHVTQAASIAGRAVNSGWEFTEAATRFGGGWTARFSVPAQVDVVAPRDDLDSEISRLVQGTVWVNRDDAAELLEVSGLELLPGQVPRGVPGEGALAANGLGPGASVESVMVDILKDYWDTEVGKRSRAELFKRLSENTELQRSMDIVIRDFNAAIGEEGA
ncbi:PIN domain-containing protein [Nocardia sp. NPDC058379]|uniref:PIN domain-containing protein n=1 Tax=unclassified Nocardia TaxID=2637762 RepID=UPI00365D6A4B